MSILDVLFILLIFSLNLQLVYYLYIFKHFPKLEDSEFITSNEGVSVIIYIKNTAKLFKKNYSALVNQNFVNFEIVVINDGSSDDSLDILEELAEKHSIIKLIDVKPVEAFWGNKKYALTLGIKAASFENLLFTKVDALPSSPFWIQEMISNLSTTKTIALGYSNYKKTPASLLNKFLRFDSFYSALHFLSYANFGMPVKGDSHNLAYKKAVFFNSNGFINHIDSKEGDNDLLINQAANEENISTSIHPNSRILLAPNVSFNTWFLEKQKQQSIAFRYKLKHKVFLSVFCTSQILFWLIAILLILNSYLVMWLVLIIILRSTVLYFSLSKQIKRVDENDLRFYIPFFEIAIVSLQFFIFIKNWTSKRTIWN